MADVGVVNDVVGPGILGWRCVGGGVVVVVVMEEEEEEEGGSECGKNDGRLDDGGRGGMPCFCLLWR
jgi:hypothetical protein